MIAYRHRRPETEDPRDYYRFLQGMSAALDDVAAMNRTLSQEEFTARLRLERLEMDRRLLKASVECERIGREERGRAA